MVDIVRPVYGEAWASVGEKVSPTLTKIQGGWIQEMMPYQWENFLQNRQDTTLLYMLQKGVPEWDASQEYIAGKSVVTYQTNLYISVLDSTNVLPTVQASWKKLNPSTSSSGLVTIAGGGTGASTAAEARINLGLGSIATATAPASNGVVVRSAADTLISRSITGTPNNIVVTNGNGVAGDISINVGSNVALLNTDSSWTSTGSIRLPSGSTSQQGASTPGRVRFNLEADEFHGAYSDGWKVLARPASAEQTPITDVGNFYTSPNVEGALQEVGLKASFVKDAILSYPDYAAASTAAATLPDSQRILAPDASSALSYFTVESGALKFEDFASDTIRMQSYTSLRSYSGASGLVLLTTPGISGSFVLDRIDTTSSDDGATVIVGAGGRRWKRVYSGRANILWWDVERNASVGQEGKIQSAIDSGLPLYAPEGVYTLALTTAITLEAGATVCALVMKTRTNIVGDGPGRTVFKIKDNESTDADPKFFNMFASNGVLEYMNLSGITFDLNGQNNKISPNRSSGVYNPYNCAALMVSGSVATTGRDARVSNSCIYRCEVINSPGVTGFAFGQRFGTSGVKGENVEVASCRFYNNGIDSADHSSIYGFCDHLSVHDCEFDFPTPSTGHQGPVACVESFGSYNKIYNNRVNNYLQFCWIGCGEEGAHTDNQVFGNSGNVSFRFLDTWSFGPQNDGIGRLQIFGNNITLTGSPLAVGSLDRVAVNLVMGVADMAGVTVRDNDFVCTDRTNNVGVVISAATGHSISGVVVQNNSLNGFSRAIAGGGDGNLLAITVSGNTLTDFQPTTSRPSDTRGIDFSGTNAFCTLTIESNTINGGDVGALPQYGVAVSGSYASLHVDGNAIRATTDLSITAAVSGRRTGSQARQFALPPTDGYWLQGDEVFNTGRVELGTAGGKYVIDGWTRATTGAGNAPSDWWQRRSPTGG